MRRKLTISVETLADTREPSTAGWVYVRGKWRGAIRDCRTTEVCARIIVSGVKNTDPGEYTRFLNLAEDAAYEFIRQQPGQ